MTRSTWTRRTLAALAATALAPVLALAETPAALAGARAETPLPARAGAADVRAGPPRPADAVILYDGELTEFSRYWREGHYSVELPEAHRSRLVRGDVSVCASKDGATVWSFPLPPGTQAILRHAPGRIEISFAAGSMASADLSVEKLSSLPAVDTPAPATAAPIDPRSLFAEPIVLAQATLAPPPPPAGEDPALLLPPAVAERPDPAAATLAEQSISIADFALEVPDSPAFTVLGLAPETSARPSNPQELVASVLNGVDRNGNFQTGLALDTAPYLLFFGPDITLTRYQESYITRLLTRAQVSFATSKGAEDEDEALRMAAGLHLTLLDRGDPRFDVDLQRTYDAIDDAMRHVRGPIRPGPGMGEAAARREAQMRPMFKAAFEEARRRNWNRTNWSLGIAPSWISPSGNGDGFQWNGVSVWNSFAYGFEGVPVLEKSSQLIVHARYRTHEAVPDPRAETEGDFLRQDSLFAGARLRIGSADTNFSFDGTYIREWADDRGGDNHAYRVAVALERRMTRNLWLSLSVGKEFGNENRDDPLLIVGSFKLGYGDDPAPIVPAPVTVTPVVFRPESSAGFAQDEHQEVAVGETAEMPPSDGIPPGDAETEVEVETHESSIPPKTGRPVIDRPLRKLTPGGAGEKPSAGVTPSKTERPVVTSPIRKLGEREADTATAPAKTGRPVVTKPIKKLGAPEERGVTPAKADRPEVRKPIRKLGAGSHQETEKPGSPRKARRPVVKQPIHKLPPQE